jgi:hypothetical protein
MQILPSMIILLLASWFASKIFLFLPMNLIDLIQQGFWYLFLGVFILAVSWLMGE